MRNKIQVNGKEYDSLEQVPEKERELVIEALRKMGSPDLLGLLRGGSSTLTYVVEGKGQPAGPDLVRTTAISPRPGASMLLVAGTMGLLALLGLILFLFVTP